MTALPYKTFSTTPGLNKWAGRVWLNFALVILLAATVLTLPADGIHAAVGILLLLGCSIHVVIHGRWIQAVILRTPNPFPAGLRRKRRFFWGLVLSGLVCGVSGMALLFSAFILLPAFCFILPVHILTGLVLAGLSIHHLAVRWNRFITRAANP